MSQFRELEVWTEREVDIPGTPMNEGDWEACVATSYSMALLYGGVSMQAPYTQAQRELIEYYGAAADRDQNLGLSDTKSMQVYGVKLRGPTLFATKAAFLARPGTGFCLTGVGSPVGAQAGTFTHEIFAYARSTTVMRVYDPLRPPGAQPTDVTITALATWMSGMAAHQVREVRKDEFVADRTVTKVPFLGADGQPQTSRKVSFAPGVIVTGYNINGEIETFKVGTTGSSASADSRCSVERTDGKQPAGPGWLYIIDGVFADHPFIKESAAVKPYPDPPKPMPPSTDCSAIQAELDATKVSLAQTKSDLEAEKTRVQTIKLAVDAHVENAVQPESAFGSAIEKL